MNPNNLFVNHRVIKIGSDGEIIERYESVREAARKNYIDPASICRRCRHIVKSDLNGGRFEYEENYEQQKKSL